MREFILGLSQVLVAVIPWLVAASLPYLSHGHIVSLLPYLLLQGHLPLGLGLTQIIQDKLSSKSLT